jgi:hypothetical protein
MALGKKDNVWKSTKTDYCYDRDNLNKALLTYKEDPMTREKINYNDVVEIYLDYYDSNKLRNNLIYRYNKLNQYIYDNPITSLARSSILIGINPLTFYFGALSVFLTGLSRRSSANNNIYMRTISGNLVKLRDVINDALPK